MCWRTPHALQHLLADDSQPQITEVRRRTRPMVVFINVQSVDPVIYVSSTRIGKTRPSWWVSLSFRQSGAGCGLYLEPAQYSEESLIPACSTNYRLRTIELLRNGSAECCGFFSLFSVPRKTIIQAAQGHLNSLVCSRLLPIRAVEHPEQAFHMDRNRRHFPHASQRLQRRLPSILRK